MTRTGDAFTGSEMGVESFSGRIGVKLGVADLSRQIPSGPLIRFPLLREVPRLVMQPEISKHRVSRMTEISQISMGLFIEAFCTFFEAHLDPVVSSCPYCALPRPDEFSSWFPYVRRRMIFFVPFYFNSFLSTVPIEVEANPHHYSYNNENFHDFLKYHVLRAAAALPK